MQKNFNFEIIKSESLIEFVRQHFEASKFESLIEKCALVCRTRLTCDQGPLAEYAREALHVVEIVLRPSDDRTRRNAAITCGAWGEEL